MPLTDIIVISLVALVFVSILVAKIKNRKRAKKAGLKPACASCPMAGPSCSCGKVDLSKYGIQEEIK